MSKNTDVADELAQLRTEVAELRRDLEHRVSGVRRGRRTAAVVAGTALLLTVAGFGSASALAGKNTVFSDDITDGNVKAADIAANAVTGAKVAANTLTGGDIDEKTLQPHLASAQDSNPYCLGDSGPEICASATLTTQTGTILVQADGSFHPHGGDQESGIVDVLVDGTVVRSIYPAAGSSTVSDEYGFSTNVLAPVAAGSHTVQLRFTEGVGTDPDLAFPHLTVLELG